MRICFVITGMKRKLIEKEWLIVPSGMTTAVKIDPTTIMKT